MPAFIEIVGLIASLVELAGLLRDMIIGIYDSLGETSGRGRFGKYLTIVEDVLTPYMSAAWQENSAMVRIVEAVRVELKRAWDLVSEWRDTNAWVRRFRAGRYAKDLESSEAVIQRFLSLIPIVAVNRTAQDGHARSGNEDMDRAFALSLHEELNGCAHCGNEGMDVATMLSLYEEEQREAITRYTSGYEARGVAGGLNCAGSPSNVGLSGYEARGVAGDLNRAGSTSNVGLSGYEARGVAGGLNPMGSTSNVGLSEGSSQVDDDEFKRAVQASLLEFYKKAPEGSLDDYDTCESSGRKL